MTNEELVKAIQDGDRDAIETLYNQNRGLIGKAIKHFVGRAEIEDLQQQAFIILTDKVGDYDKDKGKSFSSFFYSALLWGFCRYLYYAENDRGLSPAAQTLLNKYQRFESDFIQTMGRTPTKTDRRFFLRLNDKQEKLLDQILSSRNTISLSMEVGKDGDGSRTMEDVIPDSYDPFDEIEDMIDREREASEIRKAVDNLPECESMMIKARYFEDKSRPDIALENNTTLSKVNKIIDRGQQRLRRNGTLCRIARDRGFASTVYRGSLKSFEQTGFSSVERQVFHDLGLSLSLC